MKAIVWFTVGVSSSTVFVSIKSDFGAVVLVVDVVVAVVDVVAVVELVSDEVLVDVLVVEVAQANDMFKAAMNKATLRKSTGCRRVESIAAGERKTLMFDSAFCTYPCGYINLFGPKYPA